MSPILVRPVREQLEHDRLIRHLEQKYKKKLEVAFNVGDEQTTAVKIGALTLFPDLVLLEGKKLGGIIEVETGESVNNLEAMAQWVHFSRARVPFHLYVPVTAYETARRLCESNRALISEVWTYRVVGDAFDLVRMSTDASAVKQKGAGGPVSVVRIVPKPVVPPVVEPPPAPAKPVPVKPASVAAKPAPGAKPSAAAGAKAKGSPPPKPAPAPAPKAKPARKEARKEKGTAAPAVKARTAKPAPKSKSAPKARKAPAARRKATAGARRR